LTLSRTFWCHIKLQPPCGLHRAYKHKTITRDFAFISTHLQSLVLPVLTLPWLLALPQPVVKGLQTQVPIGAK
jgi:hypothetical protein